MALAKAPASVACDLASARLSWRAPVPQSHGRLSLGTGTFQDDMDDLSLHVQRYRPEELDKLAKTTKFSRKEIQLIYRGFKQSISLLPFLASCHTRDFKRMDSSFSFFLSSPSSLPFKQGVRAGGSSDPMLSFPSRYPPVSFILQGIRTSFSFFVLHHPPSPFRILAWNLKQTPFLRHFLPSFPSQLPFFPEASRMWTPVPLLLGSSL
ncbi:putative Kv channel-interacting protein 2-like [Penaeus vannamei]|uniref:Putative Kv channel-interacting protein 2-like n=1 Tax=Penaeus vannamei TaxID=6689 RepID=A0A3R7MSH3_PENVA|nr:putative Kv channel-interacting protein 2-like [Penaeus vannamei]